MIYQEFCFFLLCDLVLVLLLILLTLSNGAFCQVFFFILMVNWIGHTTLWQILSDIHWLIDRQTDRHSSQNQLYLFVKLHFNFIDAKVCSDVVFSVLLISVICVIYLSNRFLLLKHWCFFDVKYYPNFHRLQINWNSLWFIVICKLLKQQQMFNNICLI